MTSITINKGLEGIYLDQTKLSSIDGEKGKLIIRGYNIEEFANTVTNEEVLYLLLHREFPSSDELRLFDEDLRQSRHLPDITVELLKEAARNKVEPMDALRMGIASLALGKETDHIKHAMVLIASVPVILANYLRLRKNKEVNYYRDDLSQVANFLYMLDGKDPEKDRVRALETYFNTVADHGLNASTFVARTIVSTESDMNSAITGAIGALKGPKHGGAPGPALDMVIEIGSIEKAEPYIREKLEKGERIMGFGHRVYKTRDPRAEVLSKAAENLYTGEKQEFYKFVYEVEDIVLKLLEQYKPGRNLFTNVEFYTALLLHGIGFSTDIFSSLFALGRIAGWSAHCIEQYQNNRLIRPRLQYIGESGKKYSPI